MRGGASTAMRRDVERKGVRMRLQIAMDAGNTTDLLAVADQIYDVIDIFEVGTPVIMLDGSHAVRAIKDAHPDMCVLADAKIMDGGRSLSEMGFKNGADIVTVLGITNDSTVSGAVKCAERYGGYICADTIGIKADELPGRTRELEALGCGSVAVHTAHDMLGTIATPIEALKVIKANLTPGSGCKSVITGGVRPEAMPEIVAVGPDIVIVGSGICKAEDPAHVARILKEAMPA